MTDLVGTGSLHFPDQDVPAKRMERRDRSGGGRRSLLRQPGTVALGTIAALGVAGSVYFGIGYVRYERLAAAEEAAARRAELANADLQDAIARLRDRLGGADQSLNVAQRRIAELNDEARRQLAASEQAASSKTDRIAQLTRTLEQAQRDLYVAEAQRATMMARLSKSEVDAADSHARQQQQMQAGHEQLQKKMQLLAVDRDKTVAERDKLRARVGELEQRLSLLQTRQPQRPVAEMRTEPAAAPTASVAAAAATTPAASAPVAPAVRSPEPVVAAIAPAPTAATPPAAQAPAPPAGAVQAPEIAAAPSPAVTFAPAPAFATAPAATASPAASPVTASPVTASPAPVQPPAPATTTTLAAVTPPPAITFNPAPVYAPPADRTQTAPRAATPAVAVSPGGVAQFERVLASAGVDVKRLFSQYGVNRGEGGPFIPAPRGAEMAPLSAEKIAALSRLVKALPVSAPLQGYEVGSRFGVRGDPINGRASLHTGTDFRAPYGSPVYATAAGVVTYSGYRPDYGKIVEIDHGNGLMTRYGHLHRAAVSVGQRLPAHSHIGWLGSTGRATGPHVHYEILVNGEPQDPEKFIALSRIVPISAQR